MEQKTIKIGAGEMTARIFGPFDSNIRAIEHAFSVDIQNRTEEGQDGVVITGQDPTAIEQAGKVMLCLRDMAAYQDVLSDQSVRYVLDMVRAGREEDLSNLGDDCICLTTRGKPIKAKTVGQRQYVDAIRKNTLTFGVGPAGTGKTFLAVAMAVKALREKQVNRIILTRPAIEAGEKLGFLPGDLQSKIDPYLRPLYDALFEMLGPDNFQKYIERGTIEIAPLAYMRGRTLDDSFIILDEAQNTTGEQMKMFLTRLGYNSKAVVTGDLSQTDLPRGVKSGLSTAASILKNIEGIGIFEFSERDVVRHHLVRKIITAYDKYEREQIEKKQRRFTSEGGKDRK